MSLKIEFPKRQAFDPRSKPSLFSLFNSQEFLNRARKLCKQEFGIQDLFQFNIEVKNSNKWMFKCGYRECPAYLTYERDQDEDEDNPFPIYQFSGSDRMHLHSIRNFIHVDFDLLKKYLPEPTIFHFPCADSQKYLLFPEKYKKIPDAQTARQRLDEIHEQMGRGNFLHFSYKKNTNVFSLRCRFSQKTHPKLKCPWKMVWYPDVNGIPELGDDDIQDDQTVKDFNQSLMFNYAASCLQHLHYAVTPAVKKQEIEKILQSAPYQKKYQKQYFNKRERKQTKQVIEKSRKSQLFNFDEELTPEITDTDFPIMFDEKFRNSYQGYKLIFLQGNISQLPIYEVFRPLLDKLDQWQMDCKYLEEKDCSIAMKKLMKKVQSKELGCQVVFQKANCQSKSEEEEKKGEKRIKIKISHEFHCIQKTEDAKDFQDIVFLSSKLMRYLARSFWEVVYITQRSNFALNFNYDLENEQKNVQYTVMLICGTNYSQRLIILGVILCKNITNEKRFKMLYTLFKYHLKLPETVVTKHDEKQLIDGILQLRKEQKLSFKVVSIPELDQDRKDYENGFSYASEFDQYCELGAKNKTLKRQKIYSDEPENGVYTYSPYNYSAYEGISDILWRDAEEIYKECYASTKLKFDALHLEEFRQPYMASIISFHQSMTTFLKLLYEKNKKWCHRHKERYQVEHYYKFPQLNSCRRLMSKTAFDQLLFQLMKTQQSSITLMTDDFCLVEDGISVLIVEIKKAGSTVFNNFIKIKDLKTQFNYESERINKQCVCECGLRTRTGIPCAHMLKVMHYKKISLLQSIKLSKVVNLGIVKPKFKPYVRWKKLK